MEQVNEQNLLQDTNPTEINTIIGDNTTLRQLEKELNLKQYDSNRTNAATSQGRNTTTDSGLLEAARQLYKGRSRIGYSADEQGALTKGETHQRNQQDREALEKFAKEQGQWIEGVEQHLTTGYGKRIGKGAESFVYLKDKNTVIKMRTIDPEVDGSYKTIDEALESIAIHNRLFPETSMKVVAFGEDEGELNIIIEQPYISTKDCRFATQEEIEDFIKQKYQDAENDESVIGGTSYKTAAYKLQDLKPQNVIVKTVDGKEQLFVIDGDFYLSDKHKEYLREKTSQGNIQTFTTPQGEVYGFVAPNGDIFVGIQFSMVSFRRLRRTAAGHGPYGGISGLSAGSSEICCIFAAI